jgi:hypothetical protein
MIRRPRTKRTPNGRALALTERDVAIFATLARYRHVRSTYLHAFAGGASTTRFKERLGDLFHEGYLDRPEEQWRFANARYQPAVYELGRKGAKALGDAGVATPDPFTWLKDAHRQFEHSLLICECLASIELATSIAQGVRMIGWPEIAARARAKGKTLPSPFRFDGGSSTAPVVPDAIFGLEYGDGASKRYRFFALEADRGTMPVRRAGHNQSSISRKVAAYRDVLERQLPQAALGLPNLLVLTVCPSKEREQAVLAAVDGSDALAGAFLFHGLRCAVGPHPQLLLEPWARSGWPAQSIAAP